MSDIGVVILAAGMGSRFGGIKQMEPVDDHGCFIIDYSVHDALRAGAGHVVFVIKKEIEAEFRRSVGARVERYARVSYVFQELDDLPDGFCVPDGRAKPWGTGHAVLAARRAVDGPFITVQADDYYGRQVYDEMIAAMSNLGENECIMAGYALGAVLSDKGGVSRGICRTDAAGRLLSVEEHFDVRRHDSVDNAAVARNERGDSVTLPLDSPVSMNLWGFQPGVFAELGEGFRAFLRGAKEPNAEFFLPGFIQAQIDKNQLSARVHKTAAQWSGITYKDDVADLKEKIAAYKAQGLYPPKLWQDNPK